MEREALPPQEPDVVPWQAILPVDGPHSEHLPGEKLDIGDFDSDSVDLLGIFAPETSPQAPEGEGEQSPRLRFVRHSKWEVYVYCKLSTPTRWGRPGPAEGDEPRLDMAAQEQEGGQKEEQCHNKDDGGAGGGQQVSPSMEMRRESFGHGPTRMTRKQRIWEDWESWKAAKQQEMRQYRGRSREEDPNEKARREEEWSRGMARHFT